jgi:hypothetical protein
MNRPLLALNLTIKEVPDTKVAELQEVSTFYADKDAPIKIRA